MGNQGCAHLYNGEYEQAIVCHEHYFDIAKELRQANAMATALLNLGNAYQRLRHIRHAIDY